MAEPPYKAHFQPVPKPGSDMASMVVVTEGLIVEAIGNEVVLSSPPGPSLTPEAARETARRLLAAADDAERNGASDT